MIYLASPYKSNLPGIEKARFNYACTAAARLIAEGLIIYSPIAMTHPINESARDNHCSRIAKLAHKSPDFWYKFDIQMLEHCSHLIVLAISGWKESKGVSLEYKYFVKNDLQWALVPWWQIIDDKPLFVNWYRGDLIEEKAKALGV